MAWDGDAYQARFDQLAAEGKDVHGEATFVLGLGPVTPAPLGRSGPGSVLDAGCGTGRVAIELARRGVEVLGVDNDASMLATARSRAPDLAWVEADLTRLDLGRSFDVVLMAGNVPLFCAPGTQPAVVAGCARHVAPGGALVCGFQLDRNYALGDYDEHCADAGLELVERWATWDREPFPGNGDYAVSVHRRRPI